MRYPYNEAKTFSKQKAEFCKYMSAVFIFYNAPVHKVPSCANLYNECVQRGKTVQCTGLWCEM